MPDDPRADLRNPLVGGGAQGGPGAAAEDGGLQRTLSDGVISSAGESLPAAAPADVEATPQARDAVRAPDKVVQQTLFWGSMWILAAPILIWGLPPRSAWHWVAGATACCSSCASLSHWWRWQHRSWRRMLDWPLALVIVVGHVVAVMIGGYSWQDRVACAALGVTAGISMGIHRHNGYDLDWGLMYRYFGVWTVVFPYWNQSGGKLHPVWEPFGRIALIVAWVTAVYLASAVLSWRVRWPHLPTGLSTPGLPERLPALAVRHLSGAVVVVAFYRIGAASREDDSLGEWEVAWMLSALVWIAAGSALVAWMWRSDMRLLVSSPRSRAAPPPDSASSAVPQRSSSAGSALQPLSWHGRPSSILTQEQREALNRPPQRKGRRGPRQTADGDELASI